MTEQNNEQQVNENEDIQFKDLVDEILAVFRKHDAPVDVAMMALAVVASDVAVRVGIEKDVLMTNFSNVFDGVKGMPQNAVHN